MKKGLREKRKQYYIRKEYQRNFILAFFLLVALGSAISGAIIYVMSASTVTTTFENLRLTIKSTADYILPAVLLSGAITVVVVGIAAAFITLRSSHKIAGALYAIEKNIEKIAAGNLQTRFRLRSDDQIKPLAVSLDVMAHNLHTGIRDAKNALAELERALKLDYGTDLPDSVKDRLERLKSRLETFNT